MKNSIKSSLGFKLAAMILLVGMTTGVIYYYYEVHYAEIAFDERGRTRITEDANIMAVHLWNFDEYVMGLIGNALLESREVIGVRVLDEGKRVLFEKGLFAGSEVHRFLKEIRHANKSIGQLELALSHVLLSADKRGIIVTSLLVVFAAACSLFFLLQILLKNTVITPIEKLIKDIVKIGKGDLKHKVKVEYNNEFGELAQAFNQMTAKRRLAEEALQKAHDELEQRVEMRTDELKAINKQLNEEVNERRQAEEELRESEERFRALFENTTSCIFIIEDRVMKYVNQATLKTFGYTEDEMVAKNTSMMHISEEKYEEAGKIFYRAIQKEGYWHGEWPYKKKDGNIIWMASYVTALPKGGIVAILHDISEQKAAEEALRESEEKYRSMMEAMRDSVYICSPDLHVTYMNPTMIKRIGRDATGELCYKALYNTDEQCPWCVHDKALQGESAETEIVSPKDDRTYNVTNSPIFHEDGSVSKLTIYRDITATKLMQDQLIRSERLAAAGQLATSIAHEINSPLQGITSLIGVTKESCDKDSELLENIELIEDGFKRIRDTVKNLLDLNRPGKEQKQSININAVITDTLSLVKVLLKKNKIEVGLNLSARVPDILASPQQLGHVFINLINNAIEAMIGAHKAEDRKERAAAGGEVRINTRLRKGEVTIEVADTGPGISKKDMQNIFDPFYTRKKTKGIGIGLSICHGIIEDHKGSIVAKNLPAGGAVFKITLPAR